MKRFLLLCFIVLQSLNVHAEIIYSKPSGSGDGSFDASLFKNFRIHARVFRYDGDTIGVEPGTLEIGNKILYNSTAIDDLTYASLSLSDYTWVDVWAGADGAGTGFTAQLVSSGSSPGGTTNPYSNGRLIGSMYYFDSTQKITLFRNYMQNSIEGFDGFSGDGTAERRVTINIGATMESSSYIVRAFYNSHINGSYTVSPGSSTTDPANATSVSTNSFTTTNFKAHVIRASGTWPSGNKLSVSFEVIGKYTV